MRVTALADMQGSAFGKLGGSPVARGNSVPPPIEGWDAISPLAAMSPKRAFRMDNWFPQPGYVEVRKGHRRYCVTADEVIESLMTYRGVTGQSMWAAAGASLYDVTNAGTGSAPVTGLSNARFQHINFTTTGGHFLYIVNGADTPYYYNGTAWAQPTITGITASTIIGINGHKNRIWFTLINSTKVAYLPLDSIQGAATTFELGGLFTKGGYVMAMGTWSIDAGNGPDDYAVFVSSQGQVAIYAGTNPASATTWNLVGVFDLPIPLGRRCLTKVGADIAIITVAGVLPLSKAMIFESAAVANVALTHNIQRVMNESARLYGENFGWQLISYPKGTRAVLNVPIREGAVQNQFVMNTLTGAWCQFIGDNANCFELLNDNLYYGGNDGWVYRADDGGTLEGNEDTTLHTDLMTSYNYYGTPGRLKRWTACQPLISSDLKVVPGIAFNPDFRTDAPLSVESLLLPESPLWDVAEWDVDVWGTTIFITSDWITVTGIGHCAAIRVAIDIEEGEPTLQLNGFNVTFEMGAFI